MNKKEMLRDYLRLASLNCSGTYEELEYWVNKYWDNPRKELEQLKKLGNCSCKVLEKI